MESMSKWKKLRVLWFALALTIFFNPIAGWSNYRSWTLNDVSVLFPLPEELQSNHLARKESLLPTSVMEKIPRLSMRHPQEILFKQISIVSMRIDPVKLQVKLIWQPLIRSRLGYTTTVDSAIHSFYQLEEKDFFNFTKKMKAYIDKYSSSDKETSQAHPLSSKALSVHPLFYIGPPTDKEKHLVFFKDLFSQFLNSDNLFKVTAMVVRANDDFWGFLGLEKSDSSWKPLTIPHTGGSTVQTFLNQAVPFDHFENFQMSTQSWEDQSSIQQSFQSFGQSFEGNQISATEDQLRLFMRSVRSVENPLIVDVDAQDCVSCHIAQPIGKYILEKSKLARESSAAEEDFSSEELYQNKKHNLSNLTNTLNTRRIRGFGYFENEIAISQRVINESAEVADFMNKIR